MKTRIRLDQSSTRIRSLPRNILSGGIGWPPEGAPRYIRSYIEIKRCQKDARDVGSSRGASKFCA